MTKNTIRIANFAAVNIDLNISKRECAATEENTPIVLEEKGIPGAALPRLIEQCSVAILKRWLSCRGAKVTGKKGELAERYGLF